MIILGLDGGQQLYLYLQGYSMTIGEGVTMVGYADSNTNQGLLGGNAPAVHIICGWLQYNLRQLPRNNPQIIIIFRFNTIKFIH